ncbi:MAG: hypothetical protein ACK5CT_11060 [Bacteroidota bacterium]|jgi:hypothetical protein
MNADALFLMIASELIITAITIYFFARVLSAPKKKEPDSYTDN